MELPAHLESEPVWQDLRKQLRHTVGEPNYEIWLAPTKIRSWESGVLLLSAPPTMQGWVAKRFGRVIQEVARAVLNEDVRVAFAGTEGPNQSAPQTGSNPPLLDPGFHPRYTFDQFIIGDGNRFAHAAALAVAELPGQAYNPLFIHAPPGLGKTHLLHAIGNYVATFGGGAMVRYTTAEAFTNHFVDAIAGRSIDRFKHSYRHADVLLIDDVQFLAHKVKTEEEFFHTFNALHETGRQVVLSCDRLPRQLEGINQRLLDRFESGLVANIAPPDLGTRTAILRKRAALDRIPVGDPALLRLIAERVTSNVRALEGALIRIVAYQSLSGKTIDAGLVTTVLDAMYRKPAVGSSPSIADVQTSVASYYKISVEELVSSSRAERVSRPRQVAIQLARSLTTASLHDIGKAFGGRNHGTILHACKRVSERTPTEPDLQEAMHYLMKSLRADHGDRQC